MVEKFKFDVFLAHNSKDKPEVRAIAEKLKRRGLNPWLDEEQIMAGDSIPGKVQDGLIQSPVAVFFFGINGFGKFQEVWELDTLIMLCSQKNLRIIPILLPGVNNLPDEQVLFLGKKYLQFLQSVDETEPLEGLVQAITATKKTIDGIANNFKSDLIKLDSKIQPHKLIENLFDALLNPNIREAIKKFEVIAHKSLFINEEIDSKFIKKNFKIARENAKKYKIPLKIIKTKLTKKTRIGKGIEREYGIEKDYKIARDNPLEGIEGSVRIFFPKNSEKAWISNIIL